jgi:ribokinase
MTARAPRITVIGSINMDLVVRCDKLPRPGETMLAHSSAEICGGKGANQACAAARAGGAVTMIGRVGDDAFASRLLGNLNEQGICCDWVQATANCASGLAVVAVDQQGQNAILVVPGANGRVSVEDVQAARDVIAASDIVLLQLEIPLDTVLVAQRIARDAGVRVILDPAPARDEWPAELLRVDLLCPNESEAAVFCRAPVHSLQQAAAAAQSLHQMGARHVAVTLGERGTMLWDRESARHVEPFAVTAVDTTAAGDAFAGALAVRWAETDQLEAAVRFANAAGALAASREGAQPSMASRTEIEALWRKP